MIQRYYLVFRRAARNDLLKIFDYIDRESGPVRAAAFIDEILGACHALTTFPHRGTLHDRQSGIRVIGYRRRVAIAFRVRDSRVTVIAILYGGRDLGRALRRT